MILANATVDVIRPARPGSKELSLYKVEVYGRQPHDYVRHYDILAKTEDDAARDGLWLFDKEISKLIGEEDR